MGSSAFFEMHPIRRSQLLLGSAWTPAAVMDATASLNLLALSLEFQWANSRFDANGNHGLVQRPRTLVLLRIGIFQKMTR